jgi:orotidine-5'-phosphate decarboxylase
LRFTDKLQAAWQAQQSMLCVGLDPDPAKFPGAMRGKREAVADFCKRVVDATAQYASCFKPQIAYFAALRAEDQLEDLCRHVRENHPQLPLVLDSKRGDIGATAEQYAREAFERYGADAVTVNPYMGRDSVEPYLEWKERGVIVLCRTSNPGGSDLQFMQVEGKPLYQHVARMVSQWNGNGQCGLVVGATFPAELKQVRDIVGDMPLLVPGIGAQGGDVDATVKAGRTADGYGMMINSSRAILYAKPRADEDAWQAVARAARETRDAIRAVGN